MYRRDFLKKAALFTAAAAISPKRTSHAVRASKKPNILMLMSDQHRGDFMGCAGNHVIKTPNMDSIADRGVRFRHAYTSAPSCTPARTGLLTGLSPWHHGMLGYGRVADHYPVELPRVLRNAGYYTFGIGKMHWYPQKSLHGFHATLVDESGRVETPGFVSDYRKWFKKQVPDLEPDATGIGWNDYRSGTYCLDEHLHPTHWTAQQAVNFINGYDKPQPFLLKVSFARPHSPYDPPARFMEMYREEDVQKHRMGDWCSEYANLPSDHNYTIWHGDLGLGQVQRSRRGYYGSVSFIDDQIGRILNALRKRDMLDDTLIIYFSDHGDMLGDHHHWRKTYAYDGSARIPMLLSWPKSMGFDNIRGSTFDQPVEIRDILPTFLDAAGEPVPASLDGRSLLNLVRGKKDDWRPFIDIEHSACYAKLTDYHALVNNEHKYIYHACSGREQLFDLKNDPGELHNLADNPDSQKLLRQWRNRLVKHLAERGKPFVDGDKLLIRKSSMLYGPNYPGSTGQG